jgi:two-component system, LytTR family, response regulator
MKIKTVIVDDEPLARQRMRELLAAHKDIEIVGEFSSGTEAKAAQGKLAPDLLLLDVQMPRMTGLKLAQLLADAPLPLVVFVTAHDSFAVEAFDTRAVDYLLKPVRPERLARALDRVRDQLAAMREMPNEKTSAVSTREVKPALSRLMAKSGDRVVFIKTGDIEWIESAGNYVIVRAGAERHIIRETMTTLEAELPAGNFVRLNRSLIVNVKTIVELKSQGAGEYSAVLTDGKRANVTVGLRELEARLRFG